MSESVIVVKDVVKTFYIGFRRRRIDAVRGVSFDVRRGETFGLIGPNGAGKTTTLKMLMGLVRPTRGDIAILGAKAPSRESRLKVGYLPEISYYYDYLKASEILDFYGRLYGLDRATRKRRVPELLERVGLANAKDKSLRKFSKGMLQRIGLAQALIGDPDVVVLDEPQSGLDPIGRKDVADLIESLREQGKTIFFSSHILHDVERICDRVAVLVNGRIVDVGSLDSMLARRALDTEILITALSEAKAKALCDAHTALSVTSQPGRDGLRLIAGESCDVQALLQTLIEAGASIDSVIPRHETLEDVFVRDVAENSTGAEGESLSSPAAKASATGPAPSDETGGDRDDVDADVDGADEHSAEASDDEGDA